LQAAVLQHKADLGVCFDGDADRCVLVDEKGKIVGCDHLTAMLAKHALDVHQTRAMLGLTSFVPALAAGMPGPAR